MCRLHRLLDLQWLPRLTWKFSGTRFVLSRDELLTLPEFVLLSLFPNGLFPEGHMGGASEGDAVQVDVSLSKLMPTRTLLLRKCPHVS